jgi:hypothetical protein
MNYLDLLCHSYAKDNEYNASIGMPSSRLTYLADHIFDFTTYDMNISNDLAIRAVVVCNAITERTTLDYIQNPYNHHWYVIMCNMPFFADRIDWGTSIRGAFWDQDITLKSCGLWDGDNQILEMKFTREEWEGFMRAVVEFAGIKD